MPYFTNRGITPLPSAGYAANAVTFDGTTDMMQIAGALTAAPTSAVGMVSFWVQMNGTDGAYQVFFETTPNLNFAIFRTPANVFQFFFTSGFNLNMSTTTTFIASGATWHHIMASWDSGTTRRQVYVDGVSDIAGGSTAATGTANYAVETSWCFGNRAGPDTYWINANVAEFYCNLAESLDLSTPANVQKFRSTLGKPVNLGTDGSTPTGNAPSIYFKNSFATWNVNVGAGGGFTVNSGSLTAAPTSPSD